MTKEEYSKSLVEYLLIGFKDDELVWKTMSGYLTKSEILADKDNIASWLDSTLNVARRLLNQQQKEMQSKMAAVNKLLQPYDDDFIIWESSSGNMTKRELLSNDKEKEEYFDALMRVSSDILRSQANKQNKDEKQDI